MSTIFSRAQQHMKTTDFNILKNEISAYYHMESNNLIHLFTIFPPMIPLLCSLLHLTEEKRVEIKMRTIMDCVIRLQHGNRFCHGGGISIYNFNELYCYY